MKNWIIPLLIVLAGFLGFQAYSSARSARSSEDKSVANRPKTGVAEQRDISFSVTVSGEITPAEQVSVRPEVNGKIEELPVDIGDRVQQGELLFRLDDKDIKIEIEQYKTEIASANLQLAKAERDYERDKRLFEESLVAREVFEDSKTNFELSKNAIARAEQQLELAQERLSKTQINAPFDCTVLTRPVSAGQAVSGSGGFNSGTEVLTIADLNNMIINAHVNQTDVTRLKAEMKVQVDVEAVAGLSVGGVVERISPQATIVNGVKGFSARILLKNVDPRVQPGMTANIKIPVQSADQVLSVPLGAVFSEYNQALKKQERFVFVKLDDEFERRLIRIGISDYFFAEVLDGLQSGEVVSLEQPEKDAIVNLDVTANEPKLVLNGVNNPN